ncbi:MAG: FAD-dependent oxidoreductase, partial [Chloroflexi bacterium]|nr:FAD-dependent oxidoreductase [Chloroflexota bacterium]
MNTTNNNRQERAVVPLQQQASKPYLDSADIVIIGNGIAGLTAAVEARHLEPDKRIVIITDQTHPTINTPSLKQFAIGKLAREQLLAYPAGTERTERIHVVTAHVEEIHARSKYVSLGGGRGFGYGSLLIATGSTPQGLPAGLPGRDFDGVLTLHRLQDYLDLRRRLSEVSEAVVVGGGVHAIETAMGLLHWGIRVHWLIRGATLMPRILDQPASELVLEHIRRNGMIIHTETEIAGIVGRVGVVAGVITNQQEMIPCQMVLCCTGTQPAMALAGRCSVPIRQKKGIVVDDKLRSSVRDIYAAGDVAALKNPQTGDFEPRALWYAAVSQGRIAGAMLAGHTDLAVQPFGTSWHATHVGELSMLTVGEPLTKNDKVTILTDTSQNSYRRMAVMDDRLIGYLSLGARQPDSLAIKRIVDEGHSIRAITKPLLKGDFDARRYLSEMRSRVAEGILTTRKLPDLLPAPAAEEPRLPRTGPLSPEVEPRREDLRETGQEWMRETGQEWIRPPEPAEAPVPVRTRRGEE